MKNQQILKLGWQSSLFVCAVKQSLTWEPPAGIGTTLLYHQKVAPVIRKMESEKKFDDLRVLYKFLYNGQCKKNELAKRILRFKGITYNKEEKAGNDLDFKHQETLGIFTNKNLKWAMQQFDVPMPPSVERMVVAKNSEGEIQKDPEGKEIMKKVMRSADKDSMIEQAMAWLYCPKSRHKQAVSKTMAGKKRPKDSDSHAKKLQKTDKIDIINNETNLKPSPKNSAAAASGLVGSTNNGTVNGTANSTSVPANPEDREKIKAKPRPPTPSKLKLFIHRYLKNANLEEVTMKKVCQVVYDKYPEFREKMMARKNEIKNVVKEYIANT